MWRSLRLRHDGLGLNIILLSRKLVWRHVVDRTPFLSSARAAHSRSPVLYLACLNRESRKSGMPLQQHEQQE